MTSGIRLMLLVTAICFATMSASAQTAGEHRTLPAEQPSGFETVWPVLDVGNTIFVKDAQFGTTRGKFQGHTRDRLSLLVAGRQVDIPLDTIVELAKRGDSPWDGARKGAYIGAGVGLVFGIGLAASEDLSFGDTVLVCGALVGLEGGSLALWGLAIDALIPRRTTLYRSAPASSVQLMPIVTGHSAGARVTFRF